MLVFFYGLFMDKALLAKENIASGNATLGHVEDYRLKIGERATLLQSPGARAYGIVMEISEVDLERLYSDPSVRDYIPEVLQVHLANGETVRAVCYNLPRELVRGANSKYARALLELARKLGFPNDYLDQICQQDGSEN